jgi:hypothetical protein
LCRYFLEDTTYAISFKEAACMKYVKVKREDIPVTGPVEALRIVRS